MSDIWIPFTNTAAAYATQYYTSINNLFGEASEDCQNFASQCVWAGFGVASTTTDIPAVSTSLVGSDSSRVWCKDQSATYYSNWEYNWAWTYCRSFTKLIDSSTVSQAGPFGWVYYGDLYNASVGDVIQWDTGGDPSDLTVDHAMFVTATTGTKGARTMSNIYICAHNADGFTLKGTIESGDLEGCGYYTSSDHPGWVYVYQQCNEFVGGEENNGYETYWAYVLFIIDDQSGEN